MVVGDAAVSASANLSILDARYENLPAMGWRDEVQDQNGRGRSDRRRNGMGSDTIRRSNTRSKHKGWM